jgi:hypothetical protein
LFPASAGLFFLQVNPVPIGKGDGTDRAASPSLGAICEKYFKLFIAREVCS